MAFQGIELQNWNFKVLGYKIGISGYWITHLEFQDIGLEEWDFRALDHKSGIAGYWITSPTGAASASVNFI